MTDLIERIRSAERLSDERLAEMLAGLEGVTPGPYDVLAEPTPTKDRAIDELAYQVMQSEPFAEAVYLLNADGKCPATTGCGPSSKANASHFARCDPDTIRALIEEVQSLRRASSGEVREGWKLASEPVAGEVGECRYCANTGWFYGDPDLDTFCGCAFGKLREGLSPTAAPTLPVEPQGAQGVVAFDPKNKSDAIAIAIASIDGEKWVRLSDHEAHIATLARALEPFAAVADALPEAQFADSYTPTGRDVLPSMRSFRRARTALNSMKGDQE